MTEEKQEQSNTNMANQPEMSEEDVYKYLALSQTAPVPDEKHNVHTFLFRVATASDTTKIGFLKEEELGSPMYPLRAIKDYALISDMIIGNQFFKEYFAKESENVTATSLSREGFLVKQATTTTKQLADITKVKSEKNKSWFKKKDEKEDKELQT